MFLFVQIEISIKTTKIHILLCFYSKTFVIDLLKDELRNLALSWMMLIIIINNNIRNNKG